MMDDPGGGYVRTAKEHQALRKLVLKQGETFAVLDAYGEIDTDESWEFGAYHRGTRCLSRLRVLIEGEPLLLLSSEVDRDNVVLNVDLTNPDLVPGAPHANERLSRGTLHLNRRVFLEEGALHRQLTWHSYADEPVQVEIETELGADFADLFEVRGAKRAARGQVSATVLDSRCVEHAYIGLDGGERIACTQFSGTPEDLTAERARFRLRIEPQQDVVQHVVTSFERDRACAPTTTGFERALEGVRRARADAPAKACIATSNERLDDALARASADLRMLGTRTRWGDYPYAGIPWFSTVFGRDGLWTALLCNWMDPELSKGVCRTLAALQATEGSDAADAEPGKIVHEMREGEMAALGEVPFRRYYGSVDATPLFVMLAGEVFKRTGDRDFVEELWPAVEAAMGWIEGPGDPDGDGFVEYHRRAATGLANQGWKDSGDAIMHADGTLAEGPIALVEAQGYAFAARLGAASLADALGEGGRAARLREAAERLRRQFEEAFWCEEIGTYALALDGAKRQCRVVSSNVGHALLCGIASPERAARTAARLMEPSMFSGWGVRTLSVGTACYNPMSYHNGSVWPHDSAIVALGLARYGHMAEAARVAEALFEAADHLELRRLPELFCGFARLPGTAPTLYPVACAPQAWASAAMFGLVQACCGLELNAGRGRLTLTRPVLPPAYDRLALQGLALDPSRSVDIALERRGDGVTVEVLGRRGDVDLVVHM